MLGGFGKLSPIIGMEKPINYRNKVHATFSYDKTGKVIVGIYEEDSHRVIPITECMIQDVRANAIIQTVKKLMPSFKMKPYEEDYDTGFMRHLLIRTGHVSGEVMVVIVGGNPIFPSKNNFVKALVKEHPSITTVVFNLNNRRTSMVLGEKESILYGKGYIEDTLCGKTFRISPKSFYQVNAIQTEILYNKAMEMANFSGNEVLLDAYCGIGTIGIIASSRVKQVVGVELNKDAVRDAIINAKLNGVDNANFYQGDAGEVMVEMAAEGEKLDVVILDPPRSGSDENFLGALLKIAPPKVVYVSCNPETLARDLKVLTSNGYKVKEMVGVDMFPYTNHVETVVLLSHKKADTHINVNVEFGEGEGKIPVGKIVEKAEDYRSSERVTYKMIQEYIESKYGFKVHTSYVAEVKRDLGLPMYDAPNAVEELKRPRKRPTIQKVEAIRDALRHFSII